ncbi:MAG: hypothetical protein HKL85_01790 [Acidimicrobiaceae bacterium]|nr:hypothetical protein [Acidimicrobiaceae bacterium]
MPWSPNPAQSFVRTGSSEVITVLFDGAHFGQRSGDGTTRTHRARPVTSTQTLRVAPLGPAMGVTPVNGMSSPHYRHLE